MQLYRPVLCSLIVLFIFLSTISYVHADKVELNLGQNEVAYTFFDLSHGEATLLQGGMNQSVLINTGHSNSQEELEDRLRMYHVDTIDTLMITSKQAEYIGNISWILKNYPVKRIVIPASLEKKFAPLLKKYSGDVSLYKKGDTFSLFDNIHIDILYVEELKGIDEGGSAFFITHRSNKLLYLSVANFNVEEELVKEYDLKSTVFKVPDFGSDQGTSEDLLKEVDPQVAVIFKNGEDAPSNFVLERLEETWIDVYQTARIGSVTIKCMEEDYEVITVRASENNSLPKSWLTFN
ncbi:MULTISPECIES: ComEC/Rec2 family competence protein [Bacillaceae]|uniref:Beta-lactamase superfamily II metal-dependent hydrolase n=1 Tax=Evansella alkalicola TaxID=745819 RepID=A0ABS6JZ99_9BACI|nr:MULTISPECIES: hypothetical protein [Bacillaceae]MBU9723913.1 hypothetical protein [Bacillus alkalicola]